MIVFSPKPNRIMSTGTIADRGALEKMLTHMPRRSSAILTRPMSIPKGMPAAIASAMPMAKARNVVTVALCHEGSCTRSAAAASTTVKGGRRKTRSSRPTISQSTHHTRSEAIIGTRQPNRVMRAQSTYCFRPCHISSTVSR